MRAQDFIEELASQGRYCFTTESAVAALRASEVAVRGQLRRLKQRGRIASPMRSFHVIVPPEYRRIGCLPAEEFVDQLMAELKEPYYVGLLSAAARHGAAHQRPQALQVMVPTNRPCVECGRARIVFVARGDLERMPVSAFNTARGTVRYATPEGTALELVGYPRQSGGLSNVATVLAELAESIDGDKLLGAAELCPVGWSQRLGYLLELVEQKELSAVLEPFVQEHARSYAPLRRTASVAGAERVARWKLLVNVDVEPDE
jgi:predicted transcriptional regulator of viral defense system